MKPFISWNSSSRTILDDLKGGNQQWVQLTPYGEFIARNRMYLQDFTRPALEKVVMDFNSVLARLGRLFTGVPVFNGHFGFDPDATDSRRYGKIMELRLGDDGLDGLVSWNKLGMENHEEGYLVYPSVGMRMGDDLAHDAQMLALYNKAHANNPVSLAKFLDMNGRKDVRRDASGLPVYSPVELDHLALTNSPNIDEAQPLTPNSVEKLFFHPNDNEDKTPMKLPKSHQLVGISPEADADDDTLMGAIKNLSDRGDAHAALNSKLIAHANHMAGHLGGLHGAVKSAIEACNDVPMNGIGGTATSSPLKTMDTYTPASINSKPTEAEIETIANNSKGAGTDLAVVITTLGKHAASLAKQVVDLTKARAKDRVDMAINSGILTEAERAEWEKDLCASYDATDARLSKKKAGTGMALNTTGLDLSQGRKNVGDQVKTAGDRKDAENMALNAVNKRIKDEKLEGPDAFRKAWQACEKDPATAALFEALKKPAA